MCYSPASKQALGLTSRPRLKCSFFCHAFCTCCMQFLNKGWYHNLFTEVLVLLIKHFHFCAFFRWHTDPQKTSVKKISLEQYWFSIFIPVKQSRKINLISKFSNKIMITSVAQTLQYFGVTSIEVSNKRIFDEVETMTYTLSIYQSKHDWSERYLKFSWKIWPVFDVKYLHCSWVLSHLFEIVHHEFSQNVGTQDCNNRRCHSKRNNQYYKWQ